MDAASALRAPTQGLRLTWRVNALGLTAALTLLALALRLVDLGARPLWLDEAYSAWFASRDWHYLWTVVPTYEPHPPFYYSLLKLWCELVGSGAEALRGLSVLFAVLTVPVMALAAAEQERQNPSTRPQLRIGIAALLGACSPILLMLGQEARPYPLLVLAYAVATLGLLRLFREFRSGPGRVASWAMLVAGTETALWAHGLGAIYAAFLGLALAPAWLRRPINPAQLVRGATAAFVIAGFYLPCLLMIARRAGDWGTGWLSWDPWMLLQLLGLYAVPWEAMTIASAVAALVMLFLTKRAVQSAFALPGWNSERALLLLWWGPPLTAAAVSALAFPIFLPRTLAATLVPAYLALAGAAARSESRNERFLLAAALAIILPVTALQVSMRPPTEDWRAVAAYLDRNVRPGDQIWLYPNDSALPLRETGLRTSAQLRGIPGDYPAVGMPGIVRAGSPAVLSLETKQIGEVVGQPALQRVPVIWLVTRQSALFDPKHELPDALAVQRNAGEVREWGYISVRPYSRR